MVDPAGEFRSVDTVQADAEAAADYLLGSIAPDQAPRYDPQTLAEVKGALMALYAHAYEQAHHDVTGVHRPSVQAMWEGREPEVVAVQHRQAITVDSGPESLHHSIKRRNKDLADLTDRNPAVAKAMRDVAIGVERYCSTHGIDPVKAKVESVLTPTGTIYTQIHER